MEDSTPEQVEAPEGGCGLWEAHAGASSWPDRWTHGERSPHQGRFAGRTCDPVGDPTLEQFAPEGLHPMEEAMLEQGYDERSPPPEDEEVAETDELTAAPIPRPPVPLSGGKVEAGSEVEPGKMGGVGGGVLRVDFIFSFLYSVLPSNKLDEFPL
ncbi:EH domain-containing protein 4 [Grus japonensis]|uniref:EH domain-containing protein 4 n=1 Tax=Grus japonensis TaxID=30415 RepID=A0ABC9VTN3_GRUJA